MHSPDDYDFDDPHHQADLDGIIERLLKRRRADRSRVDDPLTLMLDHISNPFARDREELNEKPIKRVKKPLHRELPAASTIEELRANLGKRRGTTRGRKAQPLSEQPTLDLELIERLFNDGVTLAQIRAALHVSMSKLRLELVAFLPHIAEAATKRRGRKPQMPSSLEEEHVKRLRAQGWGWNRIGVELNASRERLRRLYDQPSTDPTTSTETPTALK